VEEGRASHQVEAMVILAKRFPRDVEKSRQDVLRLCHDPDFAEGALYAYPRGGKDVIGPSIRLAEAIAQNWGNMIQGIQEVSRGTGSSEVRAYCWELEKNTWAERVFHVPHVRYSNEKGNVALYDPRDIYEIVANQGARRLRAAILAQIPVEFTKEFVAACIAVRKAEKIDFEKVAKAFAGLKPSITREELEKYLGHPLAGMTADERVELLAMHTALKDGFKKKADYFSPKPEGPGEEKEGAASQRDTGKEEKSDDAKSDSELRATLLDLMAKLERDKKWLPEFFGVADVKVETVPRGFLMEAISALRKEAFKQAADGAGK
jgi:hypothetical protein